MAATMRDPDLKIVEIKRYPTSFPSIGGAVEQFTENLRSEVAKRGKVVKAAGAHVK